MSATVEFAKQSLEMSLASARTAEDVWDSASKFMESMTHTNADMNYGKHMTEIMCGCERFFIALSDDGALSFRHGGVAVEVRSMGGALFATEPKFTRPIYKSFNVDGECYARDAYNGILKDAFHILIDTLFDENIFV